MVISASLFKSTRYPLAFIPHNALIEELSDFYLSRHYHMNIFVSFKHQKKDVNWVHRGFTLKARQSNYVNWVHHGFAVKICQLDVSQNMSTGCTVGLL